MPSFWLIRKQLKETECQRPLDVLITTLAWVILFQGFGPPLMALPLNVSSLRIPKPQLQCSGDWCARASERLDCLSDISHWREEGSSQGLERHFR